jgi:hypothetical protein
MRLPVQPFPPPPAAENLYEVRERPPVTPARYVRARNLPPLIVPPRQKPRKAQSEDAAPPADAAPAGEERRRTDRRVAQVPVLLDTRSGRDRRQARGGQGGGVDIKA